MAENSTPPIVAVEVKNFKRVKLFAARFNGGMVILGGRNEQGKTSTIDGILSVIQPTRDVCDEPLRRGSKEGHARVTLRDGTVLERKLTPKDGKGTWTCTRPDGSNVTRAEFERELGPFAQYAFDPLRFAQQSALEQVDTLVEVSGQRETLKRIDRDRKAAYDSRTVEGRELKRLQGHLAKLVAPDEDTPTGEVSTTELLAQIQAITSEIHSNAHIRREAEQARDRVKGIDAQGNELQRRIEELQDELTATGKRRRAAEAAASNLEVRAGALQDPDPASVEVALGKAEQINTEVRVAREWRKTDRQRAASAGVVQAWTTEIASYDQEKADLIGGCDLGVAELGLDETGVTFRGTPLAQASWARTVEISTAIAMRLMPHMPIAFISNASLLDDESMATVERIVSAAGGLVIVERVGDRDEGAIVLEDGEVVA